MSRFQREAEVLASLNHPHISTIYGLEEADGLRALVLELVEGPTLAERIAEGPIRVEETLHIALEITQALEAAHEKGIIHRDLKPANVKITPEGKVKVLDFGLAKALEPELSHQELAHSPTLTMEATQAGMILGTAAYMSPEQARGRPVDKRTDIWAFGCVLMECLTGKQEFGGETVSDSIAKVLQKEPTWEVLPKATPLAIQKLLRRCLEKDLGSRLRDIGDAGLEIVEASSEPVGVATATPARWQRRIPLAALGLLMILGGAPLGPFLWNPEKDSQPPPAAVTRFPIVLAADEEMPGHASLALSPDGTKLVYAAIRDNTHGLYLRSLEEQEAKLIPGTEQGWAPFFSPDGQWVGFFSGFQRGTGRLKKWSLLGGEPETICNLVTGQGASWGEDDTIIFSDVDRLWRVSSEEGSPEPVIPEGHQYSYYPQILPGGKKVLFWIWDGLARSSVAVLSLDSGQERVLMESVLKARYLPTGHLVYGQGGSLMAAPFDLESMELGDGRPVVRGVWLGGRARPNAKFEVSQNGSLAYVPGSDVRREDALVWVDRDGQREPFLERQMSLFVPRVSPDGKRLAFQAQTQAGKGPFNIWTCEIGKCVPSPLTSKGGMAPVWSRDGTEIFFGGGDIWRIAVDSSGEPERILKREMGAAYPNSLSPNGKVLIFQKSGNILALRLDGSAKVDPVRVNRFREHSADFSPDGNRIVFTSNRSGSDEIYVKPYPSQGALIPITAEGGTRPLWSPDGKEIFYRNGAKLMAAEVQMQPDLSVRKTRELFEGTALDPIIAARHYDVTPDGRFVMVKRVKSEGGLTHNQINVVLNWSEELKRLVPTGD